MTTVSHEAAKVDAARATHPQPRVLIEEWLPAAAIGVECIRERSTGQQPPDKRLHVWWARRPLVASRAAVLGSLLPADFPREGFERLLGFGRSGDELVRIRRVMDAGVRVPGGFGCGRAFSRGILDRDLEAAHEATAALWGEDIVVIDPMAGGGSIPLEAARLGFRTLANEYNPVACSILEATVDYPFRFGSELAEKARKWAKTWTERLEKRVARFFPKRQDGLVHAYIYTRTVPCPDTQFETPLVPDWHLLKRKSGRRVVAEPVVDKKSGTWTVRIRDMEKGRGELREAPRPTYDNGKGVSLFTGRQIPADFIKAKAQAGEMKSRLYAVAVKTPQGLTFEPPRQVDFDAIAEAEAEMDRMWADWERRNLIPNERIPVGDKTGEPHAMGITSWCSLFTPRQLLGFGLLVDELRELQSQIAAVEDDTAAAAIEHLLAFSIDKMANYNSVLASWHAQRKVMRSVFDSHNFAFKATFAEMAPCGSGTGLEWAIDSTLDAWEKLARLVRSERSKPVSITLGSATGLSQLDAGSVTAVVVDPPYDDNVQYSELADFFYVWLKRTQGHRRPEWFSTYLCDRDEEAVVNVSRHRQEGEKASVAKQRARDFYRQLMTDTFREGHRILRDDGVLTVMFTHKKQEAWEALFGSLIEAQFVITATWPVKTESEHSLHQAKKNAAQSTVILVARKRPAGAGIGYFDRAMKAEIRARAQSSAGRLKGEGLNPVDQLVGSFGPALEVFSRHDEVRTDTGESVGVGRAIDEASDAVSAWRIEQLAAQGLEGVEPEGRFALLCWDVLGAAEFRFNEAKLLGHAVGMDVDQLVAAGLVTKSGDKVKILSAKKRRRDRPLEPEETVEALFGTETRRRGRRVSALRVHPNDAHFRTVMDACHALALRYLEAGGDAAGVGAAKALARQQQWKTDAPAARLMSALVEAAPEAVRYDRGKGSAGAQFPEFRSWHALLEPLFGFEPPDWEERPPDQTMLEFSESNEDEEDQYASADGDVENSRRGLN